MNQGVVQSSPVQQMVAAGGPNWWNVNNMRRPPPHHQHHSFLAAAPPAAHHQLPTSALFSAASASSWNDSHELPADSWSQLLLGGLVGEDDQDKPGNFEAKRLENITWDQQQLILNQSNSTAHVDHIKKEKYTNYDGKHPHQDLSSECNSRGSTGGAAKKARIQPCSAQSSFKVRKEKLGDRITALHQIVSPFGKTDTASVLLEAIGYIRFLQNQIEALSLPYLGGGSGISTRQQHPSDQGDQRNCLFPEDPGQLLNENCIKRKGISDLQESDEEDSTKDLRSRGLCLVPISCTLHVGSEINIGADYWAPAFGTANFR